MSANVDFPAPLANDAGGDPAPDRQADALLEFCRSRSSGRRRGRSGRPPTRPRPQGWRATSSPGAAAFRRAPPCCVRTFRGPSAAIAPSGNHDDAGPRCPHVDAVLDDDHGRLVRSTMASTAARTRRRRSGPVRSRPRPGAAGLAHRKNRRERQALFLTARQLRRRMIEGDAQAHARANSPREARSPHAQLPGFPCRRPHVVAHAGEDHLGPGVLHEQAHATLASAGRRRR